MSLTPLQLRVLAGLGGAAAALLLADLVLMLLLAVLP